MMRVIEHLIERIEALLYPSRRSCDRERLAGWQRAGRRTSRAK
jgi:hypothetical protein